MHHLQKHLDLVSLHSILEILGMLRCLSWSDHEVRAPFIMLEATFLVQLAPCTRRFNSAYRTDLIGQTATPVQKVASSSLSLVLWPHAHDIQTSRRMSVEKVMGVSRHLHIMGNPSLCKRFRLPCIAPSDLASTACFCWSSFQVPSGAKCTLSRYRSVESSRTAHCVTPIISGLPSSCTLSVSHILIQRIPR